MIDCNYLGVFEEFGESYDTFSLSAHCGFMKNLFSIILTPLELQNIVFHVYFNKFSVPLKVNEVFKLKGK